VRDFIRKLNHERGVTVILTTHDMDDIEALCTRVIMIGQGKFLFDGTLEDLRARVSTERRLIIDLEDEHAEVNDVAVTMISRDGHRVCLSFDPDHLSAAALISRITAKHAIRDLLVENPPIEEIIARLYSEAK
jgi:ABC-2 type transport system ATP-binding protein